MNPPPLVRTEVDAHQGRAPSERASPGLSALFAGMRAGGGHVVLDLGPGQPAHVRILEGLASQIRFAGPLPAGGEREDRVHSIRALPANPEAPYDVVFAWDVFDRLEADERAELVARLAEITAPRARVFFLTSGGAAPQRAPLAFTLAGPGRVIETPIGPPRPVGPELLPAAVERLLGPFAVQNAFYVRSGWREYVVVKRA